MGDRSAIEWTDATWNPTTGCDQVSPGCDHCYALTLAKRLKAMGNPRYQTDGDPRTSGPGFGVTMHDDVLEVPLRWRKPRRVFVNSMSDLFHPKVTDEFIARVFAVMAVAERHTFQVLTKRPKRMRALLNDAVWIEDVSLDIVDLTIGRGEREPSWSVSRVGDWWPLPNVWLGTSVEDQQRADERIPPLIDTPAAVRFLSCEPLLGPVDLELGECDHVRRSCEEIGCWGAVDWIIVGGESGPAARPMHPDWAHNLIRQAQTAGVPTFMKQLGAWIPADHHDATHLVHAGGPTRKAAYIVDRDKATTQRRHGHQGQYVTDEDLVDRGHPGWTRMRRTSSHNGDPRLWPAELRVREFPEAVTA